MTDLIQGIKYRQQNTKRTQNKYMKIYEIYIEEYKYAKNNYNFKSLCLVIKDEKV